MDDGKHDMDTSICLLQSFEDFFMRYSAGYDLRCDPFPGCQWRVKVYVGIRTKNVIVLVVTVTGMGPHPGYK